MSGIKFDQPEPLFTRPQAQPGNESSLGQALPVVNLLGIETLGDPTSQPTDNRTCHQDADRWGKNWLPQLVPQI